MPTDHRNTTRPNRKLPGPIQELWGLRWNTPLLWLLHLENKTIFKGTKWLATGFWGEWGGAEVVLVIWMFLFPSHLNPACTLIYKTCLLSICCMPSTVCASITCNRETWTWPLYNSSYKRCHLYLLLSDLQVVSSLVPLPASDCSTGWGSGSFPPPSISSQDLPRVLRYHRLPSVQDSTTMSKWATIPSWNWTKAQTLPPPQAPTEANWGPEQMPSLGI